MKDLFYEVSSGEIIVHQGAVGKHRILNRNYIYYKELSDNKVLFINSFKNKCLILNKSIAENGVSDRVSDLLSKEVGCETMGNLQSESKHTSFIFAITYKCNLHCSYCYQQFDSTLKKHKISMSDLKYALKTIEQYMLIYPKKMIDIGLFGGEPLLVENEEVIDTILIFCKKHKIRMHITTNGFNLDYFLKKIIINRGAISAVHTTVDNYIDNEKTRKPLDQDIQSKNSTENLLEIIRILLDYHVNVCVETNVDIHNLNCLTEMLAMFTKRKLLENPCFSWKIGRVDDRLFETNYPHIIPESAVVEKLLKIENLPHNVHAGFIKTLFNLLDKMGVDLHQKERKNNNVYCWCSSNLDNVFYIDNDLDVFRCTYTVGRKKNKLFKFNLENICNFKLKSISYLDYQECKECNIGGYCSGGCRLSHSSDRERNCSYEKDSFIKFLDNQFTPFCERKIDALEHERDFSKGGAADEDIIKTNC